MSKKRIVIAGGNGFLGQALTKELLRRDFEVVVLTRSPRDERDDEAIESEWDGEHVGEWIQFLEGAEAIVNFAGRSINCRHTRKNIRELIASRVDSVQAIAAGIHHTTRPPRLWLQASAVGFYGDRKDQWCDETTPGGQGSRAEVCRQWEDAFNSVSVPKTRRILLRMGVVLGHEGGALPILEHLTKWFLGGAAGNGRQFLSWIHLEDLMQLFQHAMVHDNFLDGVYNAVAPNPVTNAQFMRELRHVLVRPWCPPAPGWAIKLISLLTQMESSLMLESCRCVPKRIVDTGFQFQFPELRGALKNLYKPERHLQIGDG